jgi:hypothetical protein
MTEAVHPVRLLGFFNRTFHIVSSARVTDYDDAYGYNNARNKARNNATEARLNADNYRYYIDEAAAAQSMARPQCPGQWHGDQPDSTREQLASVPHTTIMGVMERLGGLADRLLVFVFVIPKLM